MSVSPGSTPNSLLGDHQYSLVELVMALPADAVQPVSARNVLKALSLFSDLDIDHPTQAWLMRATSYSERAVRDALSMLTEHGWVTRSVKHWTEGDGRRTCYVVSKGRLADIVNDNPPPWMLQKGQRSARFVPHGARIGLNSSPADRNSDAVAVAAGSSRFVAVDPAIASGVPAESANGGCIERARERARPCPTFHPTFLEYPWPTDEMKQQAVTILQACGGGLADFDRYGQRILGSLEDLLRGQWGDPAFLRCKVIPAVMKRTEKASEPDKRVKDFYLIDRNIEERREQRVTVQRGQGQAAGSSWIDKLAKGARADERAIPPHQRRAERIATCVRVIAIIESKQRPEWILDASERDIARNDTELAFSQALQRYRTELAALENGAAD